MRRLALRRGADERFQPAAIRNVDAGRKQVGEALRDFDVLEYADGRLGRDLDHDVDVAVRASVAAHPRTEQRGVRDAARAQSGLVGAKRVDDRLSVHGAILTRKEPAQQKRGACGSILNPFDALPPLPDAAPSR
jgi:hypothetical protein